MIYFIPGPLLAFVTFPGVVVHEIAHRFFCDITGVPVYSICYFQMENTLGYVIHHPTNNVRHMFFIAMGPLFVNTILCALLTLPSMVPYTITGVSDFTPFVFQILWWIGYSIGVHALPSSTDAEGLLKLTGQTPLPDSILGWMLRFLLLLFTSLIYFIGFLKFSLVDLVYAYLVSCILPSCLLS